MAYGQSLSRCRSCGAPIVWVKTKAGKNMPCDSTIINYKKDPEGRDKTVTPEGDVVTGTIVQDPMEADGSGYISHFATCKFAAAHRRSRSAS